MSWLTNCHGRVVIGKDFMGLFVRVLPYWVHMVQLSHMPDIACLMPNQKSTSRAMRMYDSAPKRFACILRSIVDCIVLGPVLVDPCKLLHRLL